MAKSKTALRVLDLDEKIKIAFFDIDGTVLKRPTPEHALKIIDDPVKGFSIPMIGDEVLSLKDSVDGLKDKYRKTRSDSDFGNYAEALARYLMSRLAQVGGRKLRRIAKQAIERALPYAFSEVLIDELREKGYRLVAISGSPQFLVDAFVKKYKFDYGIGQKYEIDPDTLEYRKTGGETWRDKHRFVEEYLDNNFPDASRDDFEIVAVGDTAGDFEILTMADKAFVINPNEGVLGRLIQERPDDCNAYGVVISKNIAVVTDFSHISMSEHGDYGAIKSSESTILTTIQTMKGFVGGIIEGGDN